MRLFEKKKPSGDTAVVQMRGGDGHPFEILNRYVPLHHGETELYRAVREAVPVVDAAIGKLIRLCGGVSVVCTESRAQTDLNRFLRTVPTGRGQRGLQSFLDCYLDSMITCGRGIGEIVPMRGGRNIAAILCGNPSDLEIKEGDTPLDFTLCARRRDGTIEELPRQDLLLFTPFMPEADQPYGVSLLRSMPFLTNILLQIFHATGKNWERVGNVRFAVTCKNDGSGSAHERVQSVAKQWSQAMQEGREGTVRDFVAAGDVEIRAIGADNQVLDSEVPVRQILEQMVAKTGIPPFLLGLSWASTERMSVQQADMMTSEITAIRRSLEPIVERICELWLAMQGYSTELRVEWEDINLQDTLEEAHAELYRQQARSVEMENAGKVGSGRADEGNFTENLSREEKKTCR